MFVIWYLSGGYQNGPHRPPTAGSITGQGPRMSLLGLWKGHASPGCSQQWLREHGDFSDGWLWCQNRQWLCWIFLGLRAVSDRPSHCSPPSLLHWGSDLHHSLKLYQVNLAPSPFSCPQALALTKSLHAESCLAICFSEDPDWHAFPRSFLKWPTYTCLVRSAQLVQLFARAISSEQPWGSHSWETGINRGHRCTGWCKQRWAT